MRAELSSNTQAILLLTAPLIAGRSKSSAEPLSNGEYRQLARGLRELQRKPADLLNPGAREVLKDCRLGLDEERLERLLGRGFLLSQTMERWQSRAIWVMSRADADYPRRLKKRLGEDAPPVLYGCGNTAILHSGGLAVVGSRNVDDTLVEYTKDVGRLTAEAQHTVISGGARGIDQAAMRGALEAGGKVAGALANGLEKAVMHREHRDALMNGRLVLICPYDPAVRFHVGHAMQRNKLIYALSDAALVVNSDYEKGGTWTGAVEQLDKLKLTPIYVRANSEMSKSLEELQKRGAKPWPNPKTPMAVSELLNAPTTTQDSTSGHMALSLDTRTKLAPFNDDRKEESTIPAAVPKPCVTAGSTPADKLFANFRELLESMDMPTTEADVAEEFQISKLQARHWLKRLVDEGAFEKLSRPSRYRPRAPLLNAHFKAADG